jgi:hypothetical protein
MAHGLHVSVGSTAVLVSALYLASAIAQPTGGKLAEVFGPAGSSSPASCWSWPAASSAPSDRTSRRWWWPAC